MRFIRAGRRPRRRIPQTTTEGTPSLCLERREPDSLGIRFPLNGQIEGELFVRRHRSGSIALHPRVGGLDKLEPPFAQSLLSHLAAHTIKIRALARLSATPRACPNVGLAPRGVLDRSSLLNLLRPLQMHLDRSAALQALAGHGLLPRLRVGASHTEFVRLILGVPAPDTPRASRRLPGCHRPCRRAWH